MCGHLSFKLAMLSCNVANNNTLNHLEFWELDMSSNAPHGHFPPNVKTPKLLYIYNYLGVFMSGAHGSQGAIRSGYRTEIHSTFLKRSLKTNS